MALARVFLRRRAQLVILDEALGQMDAIKKRELIMPRLLKFVRDHNMTLILVSHEVPRCPLPRPRAHVLTRPALYPRRWHRWGRW